MNKLSKFDVNILCVSVDQKIKLLGLYSDLELKVSGYWYTPTKDALPQIEISLIMKRFVSSIQSRPSVPCPDQAVVM